MGRLRSIPYGPNLVDGWETIGGYAISFSYSVNGISHKGLTKTSYEVQKHETFHIRYNPKHPEENNTLDSTNSRATLLTKLLTPVLVLVMLFLLLKAYIFPH